MVNTNIRFPLVDWTLPNEEAILKEIETNPYKILDVEASLKMELLAVKKEASLFKYVKNKEKIESIELIMKYPYLFKYTSHDFRSNIDNAKIAVKLRLLNYLYLPKLIALDPRLLFCKAYELL